MTDVLAAISKYEIYKETGDMWLNNVPEHWGVKRFKFLAKSEKGKLPRRIDVNQVDDAPVYMSMDYLRGGMPDQFVYDKSLEVIDEGEVLLLWDGSNSGEFIKSRKGILSSTVAHVQYFGINKKYAWYASCLIERKLRSSTIGMGIPHVDGDELNNCRFVVPKETEQVAIAKFLDKKNHANRSGDSD